MTQPDRTQLIARLCDYIKARLETGENLSLVALGKQAGLSEYHLQRTFRKVMGLTPKQYIEAERMKSLKTELKKGSDVTGAIYQAGFGSSSRVYEKLDTRIGMTPAQYRDGGGGVVISYVTLETPLGPMMLGATDRGLCFVQFGESEEELTAMLRNEYPAAHISRLSQPYPEQLAAWTTALLAHLNGTKPNLDLPLDIRATAFQMNVWRYLQTIPYGEVQSYSEVAEGMGRPTAVRAVARACASNRVGIVIPCHRVIRNTGELGGYRWGLARKRALLDAERRNASRATSV